MQPPGDADGAVAEPCPCSAAEPYSSTYDLERRVGRADLHPGYGLLVYTDLLIECRRCGARWEGLPLVGGGIYGDTLWSRLPDRSAKS